MSRAAIVVASVCFCVCGFATAETLDLQEGLDGYTGTEDTSIYSDNTGYSNGGGQSIIVGRTNGGNDRRGLLSFDVSAIPASATVEAVTLTLFVGGGRSADTLGLHRLTRAWGEGTQDTGGPDDDTEGRGTPAGAGDATWAEAESGAVSWTTPGGDFEASPSASAAAGTSGSVVFSSAGLAGDVGDWVGGAANHGWAIVGGESDSGVARRIRSSESAANSERPMLAIQYVAAAEPTPTPTPADTPAAAIPCCIRSRGIL